MPQQQPPAAAAGPKRRAGRTARRRARASATRRARPPTEHLRFHVLAVPHTVTRSDYSACPYTQNVLKFCKMMKARGHTVYHYGHADSTVSCTEHVPITDNALLEKAYGHYDWKRELFKHHVGDACNTAFNARAIEEVGRRKQAGDFLLLFWGIGHEEVAKAHSDLIVVDPGIGNFNRPFAPFNVYVSHAVMNYIYGRERIEPRWQDAVIPNYFDLSEFTYSSKGGGYLVYLGRIIKEKGVDLAVAVAKATGLPLKVAGQGDLGQVLAAAGTDAPPAGLVEHVGYLEPTARNELLRGARALLVPSQYNEPFGCVVVEAMLCGTPVISSDWGGFAEINLHGVTGYRCRTLEQYVWAVKHCEKLDRGACRRWAEDNFSLEAVAPMFEEYFNMIRGGGGEEGRTGPRRQLDWLQREYPCAK